MELQLNVYKRLGMVAILFGGLLDMVESKKCQTCENTGNVIVWDTFVTDRCNLRCSYCFVKHQEKDIDFDKVFSLMERGIMKTIYVFGGEPLLVLDKLIELLLKVDKSEIPAKEELKRGIRHLTTNGTLIEANIEKLAKYRFDLQISLDGPKDIHDACRRDIEGNGSWDRVMKGIELCHKNKINYTFHGAISRKNLNRFYDIFLFFWEQMLLKYEKNFTFACNDMANNVAQIVMEEDYTEADVQILTNEFRRIADWIWNKSDLPDYNRKQLFDSWFLKSGAVCAGGDHLLAVATNFDVYPCHRVATRNPELKLGNIWENPDVIKPHPEFQNLFEKKVMEGSTGNVDYMNWEGTRWIMWCPGTNYQTTGFACKQPSGYNYLAQRMSEEIIKIWVESNVDWCERMGLALNLQGDELKHFIEVGQIAHRYIPLLKRKAKSPDDFMTMAISLISKIAIKVSQNW
jgi:sulfatase maturation enzyme AslB (radical SAM superfamily)